jgi:uncharacterized protein (TIGR03067 family)/prepilin-type processing-associated H-X9-DG protein
MFLSRMQAVVVALGAAGMLTAYGIGSQAGGDKDKDDKQKLQGVWRVLSLEVGGKLAPAKEIAPAKLIFVGDRLVVSADTAGGEATFRLGFDKQPGQIDLTTMPDKKSVIGIYRLEGDKLLLCFGEPDKGKRPTEFKSEEPRDVLMVLERSKDEKFDGKKLAEVADRVGTNARKSQSQNNLKQIALAFHIYHDVFKGMPPQAICDDKGKPLLSWRVAILPYIEQDNLYKQFKLNEPWDSAHNIKLAEKMPDLYRAPTSEKVKPGHTHYQVITGPDTLYPKPTNKPRFQQITDGTSNTLLVVEASTAVSWTKPEDVVYDPKNALPKFGGLFSDGFNAAWCDGSVRFISSRADPMALRAVITPSGGEVFDPDKLDPPQK